MSISPCASSIRLPEEVAEQYLNMISFSGGDTASKASHEAHLLGFFFLPHSHLIILRDIRQRAELQQLLFLDGSTEDQWGWYI